MASNGHDTTLNGLLRRNLTHSAAPSENCPDSEILAAYYDHTLEQQEAARCEAHFSRCLRCRQQLAMMVRAEEPAPPAQRRAWLWDWRLLATAAAAVLVLGIWGLRRSETISIRSSTTDEPLVAMSRPEQSPAPQSAMPPPGSSQADSNAKLAAPYSAGRDTPKMQAAPPSHAPNLNPRLPPTSGNATSLPLNERIVDQLREPAPSAATADQAQASKLKKKDDSQAAAAPPATSSVAASEAGAAGQSSAGASVNRAYAPATSELSDDKALADNELKTKQGPVRRAPALAATLGGAAQLAQQRSGSTIIQTPDSKILWRVAGGNFVERTENSGASWHGQVADPDAQLTAGSAPNTKVCWLVGKSGIILLTKDTTHWKRIPPPVPADFVAIEAKNGSSATVTAVDGQKFSTDNEGKKWVPAK